MSKQSVLVNKRITKPHTCQSYIILGIENMKVAMVYPTLCSLAFNAFLHSSVDFILPSLDTFIVVGVLPDEVIQVYKCDYWSHI